MTLVVVVEWVLVCMRLECWLEGLWSACAFKYAMLPVGTVLHSMNNPK